MAVSIGRPSPSYRPAPALHHICQGHRPSDTAHTVKTPENTVNIVKLAKIFPHRKIIKIAYKIVSIALSFLYKYLKYYLSTVNKIFDHV